MNILLWVLQGMLAFLCLSGGVYKLMKPDDLARQVQALSALGWRALGVIEIVCGILLIGPAVAGWMPELTAVGAAALAVETLGISALYARRSVKLTTANPLVWSAGMAIVAAFVAYGRYVLSPFA